ERQAAVLPAAPRLEDAFAHRPSVRAEDPAGGGYREREDASCLSVFCGEAPALGLERAEAPPRFPVRADRLDSEEDGREGQQEEGPYQRERPVGQFREQYRDEQRHR